MDFSLVRGVIEEELKNDLGKLFKNIEEEPIAAASIGQVHRATLKSGEEVVLKVQYPGVDKAIEADLKFSSSLAGIINAVHKNADAKAVIAELEIRLREELDYNLERQNQQIFYDLWKDHPFVHIPRVYPTYSSQRVLCQEFKRGLNFYDFLDIASRKEKDLAIFVLNDFVFDSMHRNLVFNGDPHPGNYIFQEDGGVVFLDFGCIKRFKAHFIDDLLAMNRAIVTEDRDAFDSYILKLELILPGRPYDRDKMWDFFAYHAAPFAKDRVFEFTEEWIRQSTEVMSRDNLQQLNLPPDLIFFNRITFGLNSMFQKLGAKANWHQIYHRYLYPSRNLPPSLSLHGIDLPDKYVQARRPSDPINSLTG